MGIPMIRQSRFNMHPNVKVTIFGCRTQGYWRVVFGGTGVNCSPRYNIIDVFCYFCFSHVMYGMGVHGALTAPQADDNVYGVSYFPGPPLGVFH